MNAGTDRAAESSRERPRLTSSIDAVLGRISTACAYLSVTSVLLAMVIMLVEVFSRTFRGTSVPGAYETVETLIVLIAFLGLAYSERVGETIRVTVLADVLPRTVMAAARWVGNACGLLIAIWLAFSSAVIARGSFERGEYTTGLVNFPVWPARMVITAGFVLLCVELLVRLLRGVRRIADLENLASMPRNSTKGDSL